MFLSSRNARVINWGEYKSVPPYPHVYWMNEIYGAAIGAKSTGLNPNYSFSLQKHCLPYTVLTLMALLLPRRHYGSANIKINIKPPFFFCLCCLVQILSFSIGEKVAQASLRTFIDDWRKWSYCFCVSHWRPGGSFVNIGVWVPVAS